MEGCVANHMSPCWLKACSINLGDGVAFHGVGLVHLFRVPKEHVLVTLFTVTLDVVHHLIRCCTSIEDVDLEHFVQAFSSVGEHVETNLSAPVEACVTEDTSGVAKAIVLP